MYSAITIADEILKIAKSNDKTLTPLQLMKLVYIAHGWSLAIRNDDLFSDRIEAWKYGPVIPDLYQATKSFGRNSIPLDLIGDGVSVSDGVHSFLTEIFNKYGHLSGTELSNLTHRSGTPWDQQFVDGMFNIEIPDSIIKTYYKKLFNEHRASSTTAAA